MRDVVFDGLIKRVNRHGQSFLYMWNSFAAAIRATGIVHGDFVGELDRPYSFFIVGGVREEKLK